MLEIFLGKYSATIKLLIPNPYVAKPEKKNTKTKCQGPTANNILNIKNKERI